MLKRRRARISASKWLTVVNLMPCMSASGAKRPFKGMSVLGEERKCHTGGLRSPFDPSGSRSLGDSHKYAGLDNIGTVRFVIVDDNFYVLRLRRRLHEIHPRLYRHDSTSW
jgi:hypothetical protein